MEEYAPYAGDYSNYWKNYKWQPLGGGDHSALGDARACLDLIRHVAAAQTSDERQAAQETIQ